MIILFMSLKFNYSDTENNHTSFITSDFKSLSISMPKTVKTVKIYVKVVLRLLVDFVVSTKHL